MDGRRGTWLRLAVGASALLGLLYAATRPRFGSDPSGLGPGERSVLEDELGTTLDPVDLATAPHDLHTLESGEPIRWLFTAFDRCGSVDLSRFAAPWVSDGPRWVDALVADGRLQGGTLLREELCPVHVVSDDGESMTVLAVHHPDVRDPGDAWLRWARLTRRGDALEVCDGAVLEELGAHCSTLHR
jgi:hypothetical protein